MTPSPARTSPRHSAMKLQVVSFLLTLLTLYMAMFDYRQFQMIFFILNAAAYAMICVMSAHNANKLRPDFKLERKLTKVVGVVATVFTVFVLVMTVMDPRYAERNVFWSVALLATIIHSWLLFYVTFKSRRDLKKFNKAIRKLNPAHEFTEDEALLLFGLHSLRRTIPKQEGPITSNQNVSKSVAATQLFALHADNLYLHRRWAHELGGPDALLASQVVAAELEKRMEFCALTSTVSPGIFPRNHWASEIFQLECLHADDHMNFEKWARVLRRFSSYSRGCSVLDDPTEAAEILMKAVAAVADEMEARSHQFDLLPWDRLALTELATRGCSLRMPPLEEKACIGWMRNRRNNQPLPQTEKV